MRAQNRLKQRLLLTRDPLVQLGSYGVSYLQAGFENKCKVINIMPAQYTNF